MTCSRVPPFLMLALEAAAPFTGFCRRLEPEGQGVRPPMESALLTVAGGAVLDDYPVL
jgi:hypothetical protein